MTDVQAIRMVRENLVAARVAIDRYREMTGFAGGADPETRRLFEEILARTERHARSLAGMLKELGRMHAEHLIDESLEETFPASDAPAPAVDALQGN